VRFTRVCCAALAMSLIGGCAREAPDVRAARKTAQRYLEALARQDVEGLHLLSTNVASSGSMRGGRVLAIEAAHATNVAAIDTLVEMSVRQQRLADSLWARAGEGEADSLFDASRRAARAQVAYRNARRAAVLSIERPDPPGDVPIETRRLRVRIRYAGPLVGPRPVDRELNLRMLRTPSGPWIVYSLYLPEDDPIPASN
jgi:hypothetical protein